MVSKKVIKVLNAATGKNAYEWKFVSVGGTTRVSIDKGADIAHLDELDQKLWTVLSCPVKGLEIDERSLELMDVDKDGKIRVHEVLDTARWLTKVLKNPDDLLRQEDHLSLSAICQENEEGLKLYNSARQILENLGREGDEITVNDTADVLAIFSRTRFNGDGVITVQSCENEVQKAIVTACMQVEGAVDDRSGEPGVNEEYLEAFFTHCREFTDWMAAGKNEVMPYGEQTPYAFAAYEAIREKINDYFLRCRFAAFNEEAIQTLDVSLARLEGIADKNLTDCLEEVASYPLARVRREGALPLKEGLNPAWESRFASLKTIVFDVDFPGAEVLSEADWLQVKAKLKPFEDWKNAKKGAGVENIDSALVEQALDAVNQAALRGLMAQDKQLESEAGEIQNVDKLLHCYRDFYTLLKNFITLNDFYNRDKNVKAVFQAGTLFIDQRSCDLCLKVTDMAKQNLMANLSGMYLIYCDCQSKVKNEKMTIVAAMTDGDVSDLREGKNAVFYDRKGLDWDATVIKIVDNPISVRQAFWSPYRKFGRFINEQIGKFASEKDGKMTTDMSSKISNAGTHLSEKTENSDAAAASVAVPAGEKNKPAFDVSKFLGLFAVLGMALGTILGFMLDLLKTFFELKWYKMIGVLIGIMLMISGPSMLLAWLKLRKRDLAPILNANGWAVNAKILVNIMFGPTLTKMASFPALADPFAKKGMPLWQKIAYPLLVLAIVFAALYFSNTLSYFGLRFR